LELGLTAKEVERSSELRARRQVLRVCQDAPQYRNAILDLSQFEQRSADHRVEIVAEFEPAVGSSVVREGNRFPNPSRTEERFCIDKRVISNRRHGGRLALGGTRHVRAPRSRSMGAGTIAERLSAVIFFDGR